MTEIYEMSRNELCTIEINLDDDFANACAYHVDYATQTIGRNLVAVQMNYKFNRWVLIGLANSMEEGCDKAEMVRQELCKKYNRTSYGIEELLYKDREALLKS